MATKPRSTSVTPAAQPGTAVVNWKERLGTMAKAAAAAEVVGGKFISFKGGILTVDGNAMPDNKADFIIIGHAAENSFYEEKFNPNVIASPVCFAFGKPDEETQAYPDMAPHPKSDKPQHTQCSGCPNNAWGSDLDGGRGKACKEIRRLALLPADILKTPDKIATAAELYARIPVMSVAKWAAHVKLLSAQYGTLAWAAVTTMSVAPDIRSQFTVNFAVRATVADDAVLALLWERHKRIMEGIDFPYEKSEAQAPAAPKATGRAQPRRARVGG